MTVKPHKRLFTALVLLFVLALPREAGAQRLAVKANALSWAALAPDLGLEVVTGERTSIALSVFGNSFLGMNGYSLLAIQPEFRFWFNGRPLTREYVGVVAFAAQYDLSLPSGADRANVYRGDGIAAGLSGGYVFNLGKRFNFELSGGTGLLLFRQKQYFEQDNYEELFTDGRTEANTWGFKLFPVKLAATFIYIIK